jgi:hypothetical protein
MIKKKIIIISFIIISLIILIIVLNISKDKNKDKYKKDDRQLIHTNYYGKNSKLKYRKNQNMDFFADYQCGFTINPDDVYKIKKGKLGAVAKIDKIWRPVKDNKGIRTFDPIYIYFMTDKYNPDDIPILVDQAEEIKQLAYEMLDDGKYYFLLPWKDNLDNQWNVPDGYVVLDPLEKTFYDQRENGTFSVVRAIKKIIVERIQPFINIPLIFTDQIEDSHIRIEFNPNGGSMSSLGIDCLEKPKNKRTINYSWFDVGNVIHEFGHALGLIHEHQSPLEGGIKKDDWDQPQLINYKRKDLLQMGIDPYDPADGKLKDKYFITNIYSNYTIPEVFAAGFGFDKYSIMLYAFPNYVFKEGCQFHKTGIRKNMIPSITDYIVLNKMYPQFDKDDKAVYLDPGVLYDIYTGPDMYPFADDV